MKNATKLWGLIKGLQLAFKNGFTKLIVEGESQIIINLLRKILNGANPDRLTPIWRLSHGLQIVTDLLQPNQAIIPAHIRRKANQFVDDLANLGTNWSGLELLCNSALDPDHPILQHCIHKAGSVDSPPDGVIVQHTWQAAEVGTSHRGMEPCDGLVPLLATLLRH
jgi:hypothetical protein